MAITLTIFVYRRQPSSKLGIGERQVLEQDDASLTSDYTVVSVNQLLLKATLR